MPFRPIATEAQLRKNMRLYVITRVFQKRVFLPLAAIYFTTHAGVSLRSLGFLFSWFALVQIVAEIPTGYFADKVGKVYSLRLGAFLNVISSTMYVVFPNPVGIFIAYGFEALGYSFFGGASEAILHDTLEAQGRAGQYTKIHSRIQAASLAINAVLLAVIPLTYKIDPRLPFMIGALLYAVLLLVNLNIHEVFAPVVSIESMSVRRKFGSLAKFKTVLLFFILLGFISATYTAPSDYVSLQLKNLHVQPQLLGFVFSASSVVGVFVGLFMHLLKRLEFRSYVFFDMVLAAALPLSVWYDKAWLIIATMIVTMAFWRYRRIIYQAHLLEIFPVRQKATLLSAMNNASDIFEFGIPIVFGLIVVRHNIPAAFGVLAVAVLLVAPLLLIETSVLRKRAQTIALQ